MQSGHLALTRRLAPSLHIIKGFPLLKNMGPYTLCALLCGNGDETIRRSKSSLFIQAKEQLCQRQEVLALTTAPEALEECLAAEGMLRHGTWWELRPAATRNYSPFMHRATESVALSPKCNRRSARLHNPICHPDRVSGHSLIVVQSSTFDDCIRPVMTCSVPDCIRQVITCSVPDCIRPVMTCSVPDCIRPVMNIRTCSVPDSPVDTPLSLD